MPANPRESSDTIEIGRDYYYGPMNSEFKPIRRSSTLRSDEWDYYDRSNSNRRVRYDDYRPRYEEVDMYDRSSRPVNYQDNIYYDRWQDNPGPVVRPRVRSPSPDTAVRYEIARLKGELEDLRREERRVQHVEDASRWQLRQSKDDSDDYERRIVAERPRTTPSKPVHPVDHREASKVQNGAPHIPGLFQTVFDVNHPQDASVHLELLITDDHETELEEFCRLQRLGNFAAAEEYFKDNLETYLNNPYVFVQYGQMLLEKGDYLAFERLNAEAVFGKEDVRTLRPREKIVVVERDWSQPRVRSRSRSRSWSRPRERRREIIIRSRSQSPAESGRQQRRARFEPDSDVRIVRRRSRSRSRSRSIDRHYHGRYRDNENDRGQSPDGGAQLKVTRAETEFDELELLHQNWRLMKAICNIHSKGNYEDAFTEAWYTIENFRFGAGIGSTEIQLAKLTFEVCGHIGDIAPERYHSGLREAARNWIEWPTLFKELLVQGRVWDFKDLYVESVAAFSDPGVKPFFGTDENEIDDWISEEGDGSTNLALLDLLLEPAQVRSAFPNEMKSRAEAIIAHCPAAMRSRSFIRWILASVADGLTEYKKGEDDLWLAYKTHIQGFPGMVWHSQDCFLPGVYVPRNTENPGWVAPELPLVVNEPIQLALNLAKELKDYKSQVACLKLLIFQSPDPTQLFQELASLQKSMQGDKEGHLETILSSYLICKDRPAKEKLLEELQQTDDWRDDMVLRDGLIYWSRDFIERALKRSLQGPKSTAKLRNPPSFYLGKELPWEAEQFTRQHAEHVDFPHTIPHTTVHPPYRYTRDDPGPSSRHSIQARGQQITRPYLRPSSPSRRHFLGPEPRPQSPPDPRDDESYNRREREELELARKELQLLKEKREQEELELARKDLQRIKEKEERERRDKQDAVMMLRLAEVNKIHKEEMDKRAAEMKQLEQELKLAKENQEREARAQQDRETRERLKRAEVSLRDQAERLRRAEDRSYQEWLAGRDQKPREKTRWRRFRNKRKNSFSTMSLKSSDTYSSDSPPSSDEEDSSDDVPPRRIRKKDTVASSNGGDETAHEKRVIRRRLGSVEDVRSKPRRDEADHNDGHDIGNLQQNTCTDLILYSGVHITTSPDAYVAGDSLLRSPTSPLQDREDLDEPTKTLTSYGTRRASKTPRRSTKSSASKGESARGHSAAPRNNTDPDDMTVFVKGMGSLTTGGAQLDIKDGEEITIRTNSSERNTRGGSDNVQDEVNGSVENTNPTTSDDTTTGTVSSRPPTVQPRRREERDDLYESVRSIGVDKRHTPEKGPTRRSEKKHVDKDNRDYDRDRESDLERLRSRFERSGLSEASSVQKQPRDGYVEPLGVPRERPKSALENTQIYTKEKTEALTAEPQAVDQREETGPDAMRNIDENHGPPRPHRSESRNRDELQSKEQNERIANRPSRPASMARYGSPRSSMYDSTGVWDAWEQSKGEKAHRSNSRMIIDPASSGANTSRVSARARSRPSSMQELDDVQPVVRRTSRMDYPPPPPPVERLQSPTKRQSLIIDADGRPQPIRTTSESRHSRPGDVGSGPIIIVRRGTSADGRRSMPETPPNVAGSRSRPHSMGDVNARPHHSDPAPSTPEKVLAESWERETEGVWRKKTAVSTVHEDPEEGDEWGFSKAEVRTKEGDGSKSQASLDPEQGVSRKSTVADPEPNEE